MQIFEVSALKSDLRDASYLFLLFLPFTKMFENSRHVFEHLLSPIIAAQIFLFVLIYFTIVRKRIAEAYKLYVVFLSGFVLFLVLRPIQHFSNNPTNAIVYVRFVILFAVTLPSLLAALFLQSEFRRSRRLLFCCYGLGMAFAFAYCVVLMSVRKQFGFNLESLSWLPFEIQYSLVYWVQITGGVVLLVVPCSYLLIVELRAKRDAKLLAFLVGALLFGLLLALGTSRLLDYSVYYIGSIFSALCWGWAVYKDIHEMKGEVGLIKEELQLIVHRGKNGIAPEIELLLGKLEYLSEGNIAVYKMRIREILSMLTDTTIQAGGDTNILVQRNADLLGKIDLSSDPSIMREMVSTEAVELSEIIAEIPKRRANQIVENAKLLMGERYGEYLNIASIAQDLGVSRSHLMRQFKDVTKLTVTQHLTNVRIENAKLLLAQKTVTETAFEVGFNNSNYFSTVFKKMVGMSPVQFQNRLNKMDTNELV